MTRAGLYTSAGQAVPLRGVEVLAHVAAGYAEAVVHQRYRNDEGAPVEAIYTFPLPANAALTGFSMTCAGRRVEGEVRERERAFREYDEAVSRGHGAALLEQERANVFTANVGNLLPGEEALIEIRYVQKLAADEGSLCFRVPTLVAPRYVPPGSPAGDRSGHGTLEPTAEVPDADRISPPRGEARYGLRLDLLFDLGREVRVESPSHRIACEPAGEHRVRVSFTSGEVALDRDVVVTARGAIGSAAGLVCHRAEGEAEGYFALTVVPDLFEHTAEARAPREVVFLVDTSGSMDGASLLEAKAALRLCLRHLREGDLFTAIAFSTRWQAFEPRPVPFTQATLARADAWIESLRASGGTELLAPLVEGLRLARDGVVVLLTDGQVGNEAQILRMAPVMQSRARVYSFGIGTNVSDALLRELATRTGGAVEFIHPGERIDDKVVAQFARATSPRVTDVRVAFRGLDAGELAPAKAPDLVDGDPWTLFGRYEAPGEGAIEITGSLAGRPFRLELPASFEPEADRPAVAKLWAKERVTDLDASTLEGRRAEAMRERIIKLALDHGIATKYTSFFVVEKRTGDRRTNVQPETRVVPVNGPAGWAKFADRRDSKVGTKSSPQAMWGGAAPPKQPVADLRGGRGLKKEAFDDDDNDDIGMARPMAPPPAPPTKFGQTGRTRARPPASLPPLPSSTSYDADFEERELERSAAPTAAHGSSNARPPAPPPSLPAQAGALPPPSPTFFGSPPPLGAPLPPPPPGAQPATPARSTPMPPMVERASPGAPPPALRAEPRKPVNADPVVALLARQLASGLWAEPGKGAETSGELRATARALLELLRADVTTVHPLYGAQVRKAIEALLTLAEGLANRDPAGAELALSVAWLVASGPRTRDRIERLAGSHAALAPLRTRLGDETALRAHAERAASA